jgi:hypothetical protein
MTRAQWSPNLPQEQTIVGSNTPLFEYNLIANPISQFVLSTLLFRQFVLSSLLQVRKYILIWEVFNVADNNGARILYI